MSAAINGTGAGHALHHQIRVTLFRNSAATTKQEVTDTLDGLRERVIAAAAAEKYDLPWLKLAVFGDKKSIHGSLRNNENVLEISGVEGDYDDEAITLDQARDALVQADLAALLYTSPSHTDAKPRWRVVCPVSRPLPPGARAKLVARMNGALGGVLSVESFTLSQSYYYGTVNENPDHAAVVLAGRFIDLADELDATAIGKKKTAAPERPDFPYTPRILDGGNAPWALAGLHNECREMANAPDGAKHNMVFKSALKVGSLVGGGGLDEGTARAALADALGALRSRCANYGAAQTTLEDGFRCGLANPKSVPPRDRERFSRESQDGDAAHPASEAPDKDWIDAETGEVHQKVRRAFADGQRKPRQAPPRAEPMQGNGSQHEPPQGEPAVGETQNAAQPVEEEAKRATEAEIEAEIQRLAGVSRIAYETGRKTVAKALGVNVAWLDKSVHREQVRRHDEVARTRVKEPPPSPGEERWPDGFSMTNEGLFAIVDENSPQALISAPFEVLGESRDLHGEGWGKWISWLDADNNEHRHPVADRLLHLQTGELEATLANGGLRISSEARHKGLLRKALNGVRSGNRVTLVSGPGWKTLQDGTRAYVLPDATVIGETSERLVLHPKPDNGRLLTGTIGTSADWQTKVAAKVVGNDFAVFCIAAAFAGPMLDVIKEDSGGIHIAGGSKAGKTLAAQVGLSVYGSPHVSLRSWRATTGNLEAAGEECTDRLLVLDEIHLADERDVIKDVYLLANGVGKGRLRDDATARPNRQWCVFVISTGEHDIATVAAKAKQKVPAGADIRLPSVKAEKGDAWPNLHGHTLLQGLAEELHEAMRNQHGTIGREFIKRLSHERVVGPTDLLEAIRGMRDVFADDLPKDTDAQVHHVARRFALVACAGEIAIEWGLLPWPEGEAERAVRAVFQRWLDGRGGSGSVEVDQRVERIRHFLLTDGASRFVTLTKTPGNAWEERNPERPVLHLAGWLAARN